MAFAYLAVEYLHYN